MDRPYVTFYRSFYEALEDLPDENRLALYDAILKYSFTEEEPQLNGIDASIWKLIKPNLDSSLQRYKNGSKPKKKRNGSETEAKPKRNANNKEKDKEKEKEKDKEDNRVRSLTEFKKRRSQVIEAVAKLYPQKNVTQAHQDIVDYCESKGKNYKDYEAALRQWVRQDNFGKYEVKQTANYYNEL